ncbi:MAG TPA: fumarylacetoacetate hydrolase family protein [Gammaproteobacteria bacterium]|nr:fumarylacetoacetate hydrolase family protein [Gammaproteobacteria bacterium]
MRFASCLVDSRPRWGVIVDDDIHLCPLNTELPDDVVALITLGPDRAAEIGERLATTGESRPLSTVTLTAPIPRPRKNIICLGLNYAAHAEESLRAKGRTAELPEDPVVFTKSVGSVNGPYGDILLDPEVTEQLDWEVELGVVIGQRAHKVDAAGARAAIFGYTVINDVSARDLQFRHKQFFMGKSLDGACPMGPWLVTADEIPDPQQLALACRVNGESKQQGNTSDQIFGVVDTVRRLSAVMTLEPGDIIATGTPDGVGFARTPPEFLHAGDVVECDIESIGVIRNRIVAPVRTG